jgi:hypothetical protein
LRKIFKNSKSSGGGLVAIIPGLFFIKFSVIFLICSPVFHSENITSGRPVIMVLWWSRYAEKRSSYESFLNMATVLAVEISLSCIIYYGFDLNFVHAIPL